MADRALSHQPLERVVLGIDPGTATTGYGVVARTAGGDLRFLACGVIRTASEQPMHLRLLEIYQDLSGLVQEFQPREMAVEELFFGRNVSTAITVGQARGMALLVAAQHNLAVGEYKPAEIKVAIAGYGNAEKRQVQEMVRQMLHLSQIPRPDDAADGIAVAICHLQQVQYQALVDSTIDS